jgi:PAS domain S-box-containing protein
MQNKKHNKDRIPGENDFRTNDSLYREIFENCSAAIVVFEADAEITMVNEAFCKLSGYTKDELTGTKWTDKMPPEEIERLKEYNRKRKLGSPDVPIEYEAVFFTREKKLRSALFSASLIKSSMRTVLTVIDISEKKQALEKLQISEERFRSMVEYAADIVFSISKDAVFTYISPNWKEIMGHDVDEIIGTSFIPLIHPNDIGSLKTKMAEHFSTGKKFSGVEYRVKHKNGSWRWHSASTSPLVTSDGEISSLIGIARDITDRKNMEESLAENELFFRESQQAANIGSFKYNIEEKYLELSEVLEDIYGFERSIDKKINHEWETVLHPDDREYILNYLRDVIIDKQKQFNTEYRIIRRSDSETRWVHGIGKLVFDENRKPKSLIGTVQDITYRKRSEQAIRDHQIQLNIALKIARLGPWELNMEENLFHFNDTFYSIFKTSSQEVGGNTMTPEEYANRFIYPDDRYLVAQEIEKAVNTTDTEHTCQIEHRMLYANGEMGYVAVRFAVIKNDKGKTIKTFGLNQDITSIRKAENKLKESEAQLRELNSMKDKFFSIIAHDLKSPLSAIAGLSELLAENVNAKDLDEVETLSTFILQSSKKAIELLTNLMEWSRSETGRMEFTPKKLSLRETINKTVEIFTLNAQSKRITINSDIPESLYVFADLAMLSTILRNLISNALKFTFANGKIDISTTENENEVIVEVADNGKGMSEEILKKLFRIDENISSMGTENEKGTGLGLILCKEFVEKHGGRIWVKSEEGKGSSFYFSISK